MTTSDSNVDEPSYHLTCLGLETGQSRQVILNEQQNNSSIRDVKQTI